MRPMRWCSRSMAIRCMLSQYYGPGFTLVYFYPRAETSGARSRPAACAMPSTS